jgi:hypothetical protein
MIRKAEKPVPERPQRACRGEAILSRHQPHVAKSKELRGEACEPRGCRELLGECPPAAPAPAAIGTDDRRGAARHGRKFVLPLERLEPILRQLVSQRGSDAERRVIVQLSGGSTRRAGDRGGSAGRGGRGGARTETVQESRVAGGGVFRRSSDAAGVDPGGCEDIPRPRRHGESGGNGAGNRSRAGLGGFRQQRGSDGAGGRTCWNRGTDTSTWKGR